MSSARKLLKYSIFKQAKCNEFIETLGVDPYEAVVLLLPVAIRKRLLKFCGLIAVESLTNLAQLPESNVILVLDQFMLSGAESMIREHNLRH
nr:nucleotide-binding, alpha-beta plait [Tanacetum cinerariifolium]